MRGNDFLNKMGLVDAAFVEEADRQYGVIINVPKQNFKKGGKTMYKKIAVAAAMFVLMVCSGAIGAIAFSTETFIEVPVKQETIALEEIGITLILPDTWNGQYAVEKNGHDEYIVYNPNIRDAVETETGLDGVGGMLFYIMKWDEQLTEENAKDGEWNFTRNKYIVTTKDGTYFLYYASDVQYTDDTMDLYHQMASEISSIRFVIDNAFDD